MQGSELFGDLERDRLHGLDGSDSPRSQILIKTSLAREFPSDLLRLIIGAGHLDHLAAIEGNLPHFDGGHQAGDKRP